MGRQSCPIIGFWPIFPYKTSLQPMGYIAEWLRFLHMVVKRELWSLLMTYRKSYIGFSKNPFTWPLKSKMAEIRHLENRHDVIFFCWEWSDFDKISQIGAEWHADCGDMVKIFETRCRIPIWRTSGRIPWHIIPEPPATLQSAATWRILCHDLRATCHIAGCCHLVNSLGQVP